MGDGKITKTYVLKGTPEILERIERLLSWFSLNGSWGHSGTVAMGFDGDGSDRLDIVSGFTPGDHKEEVESLNNKSPVEMLVEYVGDNPGNKKKSDLIVKSLIFFKRR